MVINKGVNLLRKSYLFPRLAMKAILRKLPYFLINPASKNLRPKVTKRSKHKILIGPANFAGQAWQWSRALSRSNEDIFALSQSVDRGGISFPAHYRIGVPTYRNKQWGKSHFDWIEGNFDWLLIDGMRPILGPLFGEDCIREVDKFLSSGIKVGLIAHGSDIRVPSQHADLYSESPFRKVPNDKRDWVGRLEKQSRVWNEYFNSFEGPTFISTLDLLDFAPNATWLPVVEEVEEWKCDAQVLKNSKPRVLHAPSNGFLKGSEEIDKTLLRLQEKGLVEYVRVQNVPQSEMNSLIKSVDIVVDQTVLGTVVTGTAVQALSAGKIVVSYSQGQAEAFLRSIKCPVVTSDTKSLASVIKEIISNVHINTSHSNAGVNYATTFHSGEKSADIISRKLGLKYG